MESIGNFASVVAHDFGNFVSFILATVDALRDVSATDPSAAKSLAAIEMAATRARHLSEELIRFARGGRSRLATVDVNWLIEDVVVLIRSSVGMNVDVRLELADGLGSVEGDEVELQQIVLSLCLNARDAMKEGGTLTIETRPLGPEQLMLLGEATSARSGVGLVFRDTGIGIRPEVRDRIFEPFFSTKDEQRGLGLAMVYASVRRHGGLIDVRSEPGVGTTFEILLPTARDERPEPMTKTQVLVADDEPAFREMIRLILEEEGHQVCLAKDGTEALAVLEADGVDIGLVILDLHMPGVDGLGVLQRMQQMAPDLPVLVATGWAEPDELEMARQRGARAIVQKPYRAGKLRQEVARVLASERARAALREDTGTRPALVGAMPDGTAASRARPSQRWSGIFSRPNLSTATRPPSG
jgi:CheY-like chemotaxis protein